METTTQPTGIYAALAAIAAEIGAITKQKRVQMQQGGGYAYRGIDDVYNALNPLLGKHGVFVLPIAGERTSTQGEKKKIVTIRMVYRFCHSDGSYVECATVGEGMDSGDKATNKAMAIAHKYAILQTFCIPTEDMDDPDAVHEDFVPQKQPTAQRKSSAKDAPKTPRQQLFDVMTKKFGKGEEANQNIYAELSHFFSRDITSSNDLSDTDISEFLSVLQPQDVDTVNF